MKASDGSGTVLNLLTQLAVLATQVIISFFLTPVILKSLGDEAYGFVGLVNNFVSYMSVITTALNSLAGRYISLSYFRSEMEESRKYYSSVFFGNCFLGLCAFFIAIVLSIKIDNLVVVPNDLLDDLRLLVLLAFFNAAISLFSVVFGVAAFIKNRLFYNYIAQLSGSVLRMAMLSGMFIYLEPHMWYYGVTAIVATVVTLGLQIRATIKLAPELKVRFDAFSLRYVMNIVKDGAWVSLESVNKLLQTGLDLLVANLYVGPAAMGLLSVAKTIPNVLGQLSVNVANVMYPKLAKEYATGEMDSLNKRFSFSMRFTGYIVLVPLIGFVSFGFPFYRLWLQGKDAEQIYVIQQLSALTVLPLVASCMVEPLYYANTLTRRLRGSVIIATCFSLASLACTLLLLNFSAIEPLYIIASTSSIFMTVRHLVSCPLYYSHILGLRPGAIYLDIVRMLTGAAGLLLFFGGASKALDLTSWPSLIACCLICGITAYVALIPLLFSREELSGILRIAHVGRGRR